MKKLVKKKNEGWFKKWYLPTVLNIFKYITVKFTLKKIHMEPLGNANYSPASALKNVAVQHGDEMVLETDSKIFICFSIILS